MQGFTYTELTNALQTWPNDTAPEYQEDLDRIIQLGELKLIKDLNIELFDATDATPVVTLGSRLVTKPDGCISTRSLFLVSAGTRTPLLLRAVEFCNLYAPNTTTDTGTPTYYAELNDTQWYLVKTPIANATVEAHFVKRPESIVDADSTWLGDNCGDLLFMACLSCAERWLKADDRWSDIQTDYADALQKWQFENRNLMKKGDYMPPLPTATVSK